MVWKEDEPVKLPWWMGGGVDPFWQFGNWATTKTMDKIQDNLNKYGNIWGPSINQDWKRPPPGTQAPDTEPSLPPPRYPDPETYPPKDTEEPRTSPPVKYKRYKKFPGRRSNWWYGKRKRKIKDHWVVRATKPMNKSYYN